MKRIIILVMLAVMIGSTAEASENENLYYSILLPGWGQLRTGHYGKGSIFMGAELVSLLSIVVTQVQYNRAVEQYDRAKNFYLNASYIGDAVDNYNLMLRKWDDAERLYKYRKAFIGAAIGVYVINVVDMALFSREERAPLNLTLKDGGFLLTTGFSF